MNWVHMQGLERDKFGETSGCQIQRHAVSRSNLCILQFLIICETLLNFHEQGLSYLKFLILLKLTIKGLAQSAWTSNRLNSK
jgi:hypothetical protein